MKVPRSLHAGAALALAIGPIGAQDAATTLGALLQRADAVVHARYLGSTHVGERRAARFATLRTLAGSTNSEAFTPTEPDGRACGRALAGLIPGAAYVAFLDQRTPTAPRLASSGSRALPLATPELVRHLQLLIESPAEDWTRHFAASLEAQDPRVRTDAALDLARRPDVERLPSTGRTAVLDALTRGLEDETAPLTALVQATARCRPEGSANVLVRHFVTATTPWLDACVLAALERFPAEEVAACVPSHPHRGGRTVAIAERLEPHAGAPILAAIAVGDIDHSARTRAATALSLRGYRPGDLLRIGVRPADLPVSGLPQRHAPRFRSINPALAMPGPAR